jgi:hypothetical protein
MHGARAHRSRIVSIDCTRSGAAIFDALVVRFTNNVSVSLVFDVRQPTLLRNAAMHAVANSVSLVE